MGETEDDDLLRPAGESPRWRRLGCRVFALSGVVALIGTSMVVAAAQPPAAALEPVMEEAVLTAVPTPTRTTESYGSCPAQPSLFAPLRWGSKTDTADHICWCAATWMEKKMGTLRTLRRAGKILAHRFLPR